MSASAPNPAGDAVPASTQPEAALILNRYKLTQELARGGYGVVFSARDTTTGQAVAIKRMLSNDPHQINRFDREMKLTSKLKSPYTVRLLDFGQHEGSPVMVMEFVEGQPLQDRLKQGPLSGSIARRVISQALESLVEAHSYGIVHRDLKPANIMLTQSPDLPCAKVLDFGTAGVANDHQDEQHQKITAYGEIQGTPAYMAPEQIINFSDACTQSDLYAMGLILFECLTGKRAVNGPHSLEICRIQVQEPIVIEQALREGHFGPIIEKATEKKTADRYQTAQEMLNDLNALDLNSPSKRQTQRREREAQEAARRLQQQREKKRVSMIVGLIVGLSVLLVGVAVALWVV
jgi:serine/threonine protein kinase